MDATIRARSRRVGRKIVLNGEPHEIVGIMPPSFSYPSREFEIWVPLTINPEDYVTRLGYNFLSVGRLRPGVTLAAAQADLDAIAAQLASEYPNPNKDVGFLVQPMRADLVRDVRRPLLLLLAGVASLLLIGCASLANLLIARAVSRSSELVLRAALGAGRGRLVRQSLTELLPLLRARRARRRVAGTTASRASPFRSCRRRCRESRRLTWICTSCCLPPARCC